MKITPPVDILAFSPHPDDVEIGCGGSLLLASQQALKMVIVDVTAGEMASRGNAEQRRHEKEQAAAILGVSRIDLGLPDTKLGEDPHQWQVLVDVLRATQPKIVLAPYAEDRHPDHVATAHLVKKACFYAAVPKIGQAAPHRIQRLYHYMLHHPFAPTFVIDVSTVWQKKLAAIESYRSQFHTEGPYPQTALSGEAFREFLIARAIYHGRMIGVAYGEPFFSAGPLAFKQFPDISDGGATVPDPNHYCMY